MALTVTLLPSTLIEISQRRQQIKEDSEKSFERSTNELALNLELMLWNYAYPEAQEFIESSATQAHFKRVRVRDSKNIILFDSKKQNLAKSTSESFDRTAPIIHSGRNIGSVEVIFDRTDANFKLKRAFIEPLVRASVIAFALFLLTGLLLKLSILTRIQTLARQANELKNKNLDTPFHWVPNDELGRLGANLEETRASLLSAFAQNRIINENLAEVNRNLEALVAAKTAQAVHASRLSSLGEMAASVAHEINNPLAIIDTTLYTLPAHTKDAKKLANKIEVINRATQRIAKIVMGLRKFSRTSERSAHAPVPIQKLMEEVITLTQAKAKGSSTSVVLICASESQISCNEIEIEQVMVNLISNAIDAVKHLAEKWVRVEVRDLASSIIVSVTDSGTGISKEMAEKIFQPFFTTKAVGEGTGLGLSIVKGILEDHKATIELVEESPHTCFEITFEKISAIKSAS